MSFLALSTTQILVLAVLTAAAVVALFFLKLRHRRVVIGSSLLWQRVLDERDTHSLIEKLRRWLSLVLALAIGLLIAVSLGRPYFTALGEPARPVIVVLDTSPSMETRTGSGGTRWDEAVSRAREIVSRGGLAGVMAADTGGRVQTALTEDTEAALSAIGRMRPAFGPRRFPSVPGDAAVYFITDGVDAPDRPESVTTISVFEPADNVAVTAFEIGVDPTSASGYAAYLEVVNYSAAPKDVAIQLGGAGSESLGQTERLEPGQSWSRTLTLAEFQGGGMLARVRADGDAYPGDDRAFGYLPIRSRIPVTLVTDSRSSYLETLLRLSPSIELRVVRPADFREDPSTEAYIFDGFVPPAAPARPSLVFGWRDAAWLPTRRGIEAAPALVSWDAGHPIMRFVPATDLRIDAAPILFISDDAGTRRAVASSAETPLILVDEASESVLVGFDLDASDFPFHLGFPIFVQNVLAWFSGEVPAERRGLGEIELPADTTAVTRLDGSPVDTEARFGRTVIEASEPELFTALAGGRRIRVAASQTERRFSDVNRSEFAAGGRQAGPALALAGNELWIYMLLGALGLVTLEWWTYNRRITL